MGGVDREAVAQRLGACAQLLKLFNESLLLMDEVDVLLHPLRSELNFIIGPRVDLDLSSSRKLRTSLLVLSRAFYYREIKPLLVQWTLLYWSPTNPRVSVNRRTHGLSFGRRHDAIRARSRTPAAGTLRSLYVMSEAGLGDVTDLSLVIVGAPQASESGPRLAGQLPAARIVQGGSSDVRATQPGVP